MGANYQYAHSIDDASSVGGTGSVVAQDWQNIAADEGNSTIDVRHNVSGNYVYALPFGADKHYVTTGTWSHVLEGLSMSGNLTFATGTPLTSTYQASFLDVSRGTTRTQRPDRVPGKSLTAGGGSLKRWFNTSAFGAPAGLNGTAARTSIPGLGTVSNNMSLSKTLQLGDTRSVEIRATAENVFNTVQYAGVDTTLPSSQDCPICEFVRTGDLGGIDTVISVYGEVLVLKAAKLAKFAALAALAKCDSANQRLYG